MWTRRAFIAAAGAGFAAGLAPRRAEALAQSELVFATSAKMPDGSFAAALINERGGLIVRIALPGRGHDVTECPVTGRLVVFARRPGTFALVFDRQGNVSETLTSPEGRHFFGHGVFAPDGRLLYATENAYEVAEGRIGIYDATDRFRRIGEFDSFGMDPHDIFLSADGTTLCIANGGLETHPDYGRTMLNLATMEPNLAFIDLRDGSLIARHGLPPELHQLSFHHLAPGGNGLAWVGGQFWGPQNELVPLLASAGPDRELRFAPLPEAATAHLNFYVGSVAASPDGDEIVATSPTGGTAVHFNTVSGKTQLLHAADICGADWALEGFAYSGGEELIVGKSEPRAAGLAFDNHLKTLNV